MTISPFYWWEDFNRSENQKIQHFMLDAYVRNETFDAGNLYVGKYADVEAVTEELYPELLGRWRDYLRTGKTQYIDYYKYANSDLKKIEAEIKTAEERIEACPAAEGSDYIVKMRLSPNANLQDR